MIIPPFFTRYFQKDLWLLMFLGISSGVPFLLILSTLSYWLNELSFSPSEVSLFTAVSIPYSLKAFWAPFLEKYSIPYISKYFKGKKSFAFISQIFLCVLLYEIGFIDPVKETYILAGIAFFVSFFAATQDIVIDGLRIERFSDKSTGTAASFSGVGFHLGKLASGSGTLYLAHWYDWQTAYQLMIFGIIPGMVALYFFDSLKSEKKSEREPFSLKMTLKSLTIYKNLYWMILFIILFKIYDAVLQGTSATFFYQLGLSKVEFANLTKVYGTVWVLIGTILGGLSIDIFGLYAATLTAAILQAIACLLFAIQAHIGYDVMILTISIGVENFTSGLVLCTAISMISSYVKKPYSMSHYTLFYTIGSLSRVIVSALSGYFADCFGWTVLYCSIALFVVPIALVVYKLQRFDKLEKVKYDRH